MGVVQLTFDAIGTRWTIEVFEDISGTDLKALKRSILRRIDTFDQVYSRFRTDSVVSRMARSAGAYTLPDDAAALIELYQKLYTATNGLMTPLIGQTLSEAGYDAEYSLTPKPLSRPPRWEDVMEYQAPVLQLKQPALIDFGAAGKGYLADIVSGLIMNEGVRNFCINAGGDIVCHTDTNERLEVALEHPMDASMAIGVARLRNQSLCGSSGNRRKWESFHHIINPATLQSPQHIAALWVTAENGLIADGLSTAPFFVPPERLLSEFNFEYAIVDREGRLDYSKGFPADFYVGTGSETIK